MCQLLRVTLWSLKNILQFDIALHCMFSNSFFYAPSRATEVPFKCIALRVLTIPQYTTKQFFILLQHQDFYLSLGQPYTLSLSFGVLS